MASPEIEARLEKGRAAYEGTSETDDPLFLLQAMIEAHTEFASVSNAGHSITETLDWAEWNMRLGRMFTKAQDMLDGESLVLARRAVMQSYLMAVPALMATNERDIWAAVQMDLAEAFEAYASGLSRSEAREYLEFAVQACEKALEVFEDKETEELSAEAHARAAVLLSRLAELRPEEEMLETLNEAWHHFETAFEQITLEDHGDRYLSLNEIARATLGLMKQLNSDPVAVGTAALDLQDLINNALDATSPEQDPEVWVSLMESKAECYEDLAKVDPSNAEEVYEKAIETLEDILAHIDLEMLDPLEGRARLKLGQALLVKSNRSERGDQAALDGAITHLEIAVEILHSSQGVPPGHPQAYLGFVHFLKAVAIETADFVILDHLARSESMLTEAMSMIDPADDPTMLDAVQENMRALQEYRSSLF